MAKVHLFQEAPRRRLCAQRLKRKAFEVRLCRSSLPHSRAFIFLGIIIHVVVVVIVVVQLCVPVYATHHELVVSAHRLGRAFDNDDCEIVRD